MTYFVIGVGFVALGSFYTIVLGRVVREASARPWPSLAICVVIAACAYLGIHCFVAYLRGF